MVGRECVGAKIYNQSLISGAERLRPVLRSPLDILCGVMQAYLT